jgi:hypothetical protein
VFFIVLVMACSSGTTRARIDPTGLDLKDGRSVSDLGQMSDPVFVLLYDPASCFSCGGFLPIWIETARRLENTMFLVFTREPSEAEARVLAGSRMHVEGVLRSLPPIQTGAAWEFVFLAGELVYEAIVEPEALSTDALTAFQNQEPRDAARGLARGG